MGIAGPQKPELGWARKYGVLLVCLLAFVLLGLPLLRKWQRESVRVEKERRWVRQAVQRLQQAGPPTDLSQSPPYAAWIFEFTPENPQDISGFLSAEDYKALIG